MEAGDEVGDGFEDIFFAKGMREEICNEHGVVLRHLQTQRRHGAHLEKVERTRQRCADHGNDVGLVSGLLDVFAQALATAAERGHALRFDEGAARNELRQAHGFGDGAGQAQNGGEALSAIRRDFVVQGSDHADEKLEQNSIDEIRPDVRIQMVIDVDGEIRDALGDAAEERSCAFVGDDSMREERLDALRREGRQRQFAFRLSCGVGVGEVDEGVDGEERNCIRDVQNRSVFRSGAPSIEDVFGKKIGALLQELFLNRGIIRLLFFSWRCSEEERLEFFGFVKRTESAHEGNSESDRGEGDIF